MEPVDLWRIDDDPVVWIEAPNVERRYVIPPHGATKYVALPRADYEALLREKQEARETNQRLNRRCQRAEAMPKWADLGIAAELRNAIEMVRHRYRVAAHCARSAAREWSDHTAKFYADMIQEWITNGRPANHICPPFDAIIDDARATKEALHAATARAERAERALRWYAEEYNYHPWDGRDGAKDGIPALEDRGAKAREALEGGPHA